MKRLIGTFFIAFMLFFTLSFMVYAQNVSVESKDDLNIILTSNDTFKLTQDISVKTIIKIADKQNITIDLNGFEITNTNDVPFLQIKNCQNIKFIDSSEEKSGTICISLSDAEKYMSDSQYIAIEINNSTVSIEGIKIEFNSENKGLNTQLFNLTNKSELQLINCDITTNNIGKVIKADNSKVYLGKNDQELAATNLPEKLTKVTVENLVVPSREITAIESHTGAICLDNESLIEVFADICLKSYVMQTDKTGCEGSASAILSNNSAVNIYGGSVENRCESDAKNTIYLYAIEAYKPSEINGLVISYKANEFDTNRIYGTELISNQDTIFVSPVEIGSENYDNPCNNYKITLDYASIVSGDGCKAITSISKYLDSSYNNIVIDSKGLLVYGNVIYRQGLNDSATEDRDNKYSYFGFCNDDSNDKYIVLTRDLEIGEYRTLYFQDVNVVVAKEAILNVLGAIENNKASGVNNSKLQINGQYELRGKCNYDIYVYGKATIYELTNANMYPKENGDIYLDASLVRFILKNKLTYNKERQTPVFDAYFGNRLVKELSPGNTIEFEQDKQFKVSASSSSIFVFAGNGKIVSIIRINNSSTNSHFYMTEDTTTTFDIEKADYLTLNPGKNLRADINIKKIKYGYKESVSLKDFLYDDDKREYQWYREVNGEQIKIQGECEFEYIIRAEDIGNKIYCQVSFGNYKDVITSDKVTVGKGTASEITFPNVSDISYPQRISEAKLTGENSNGTFTWEDPDEILVPGTYTRNLIFIPNNSHLYDYSNVTLKKEVSIKVNKGVPSSITFPENAKVEYPSPIKNAEFSGVSTNGTFAWENPDEQLPPGTYTRKIIFTPNDSDLYDYTNVELIKEVPLTVNKVDPQSFNIISQNISELSGSRKITLCYQVCNKSGVNTPTGSITLIYRVTDNGETQTDEEIAKLDLVYGKTEVHTCNIANDNNSAIIAQYSGDDYYNSMEISTALNYKVSYQYGNDVPNVPKLPVTKNINCGVQVTAAAAPTLAGYDFSGWRVKTPTGLALNDGRFNMPLSDVILEGSWTVHTYTVSYDKNADEANGTTAASSHTYDKESKLTANGYSNPGFVFAGWSTAPNGNAIVYKDEAMVKNLTADNNGQVILYAVWTACTPVTANLPIQNELAGNEDPTPETFTFKLEAESNTAGLSAMPMPVAANGKQNMEADIIGEGSLEFGKITFTKPGTYVYKITELDNGLTGYTYDKAAYMVGYVVTQNGDTLEIVRTITKDGSPTKNVVFTNNYIPTSVKGIKVSVENVVNGDKSTPSENFVFTIKAENKNSPMPIDGSEITINGSGKAEFGEIEFTKTGTYVYTVNVKDSGIRNYKYDMAVYTVTYTVTDKDGILDVSSIITKDGSKLHKIVYTMELLTPAPTTYRIIDGADSTWTKISDGTLTIRGDGALADFVSVKVDGNVISKDNYIVVSGSTIITLKKSYLDTLSADKHTIEIVWKDGSVATTFTVKAAADTDSNSNKTSAEKIASPKTGDYSLIILMFVLLMVSGFGLIVLGINRRHRNQMN